MLSIARAFPRLLAEAAVSTSCVRTKVDGWMDGWMEGRVRRGGPSLQTRQTKQLAAQTTFVVFSVPSLLSLSLSP